jgi:hypothetical protein
MTPKIAAAAIGAFLPLLAPIRLQAQDPQTVWTEFREALRGGQITLDRIHPLRPELREPMLGFLNQIRAAADWREFAAPAERFVVGDAVHFLIPLTFNGTKDTYCFSFVIEQGRWYFQHLESISIRLDRTPAPPTSSFPDLAEDKKAWIREERRVTDQVKLFHFLAGEKGRDFAREWFLDGVSYALQARTWVPFLEPSRAFVLFVCWDEARLKSSRVTLERLDEHQAVVRLEPIYLKLYDQTAHIKQDISREDYLELFREIWRDRAKQAGWQVEIDIQGQSARLLFRR